MVYLDHIKWDVKFGSVDKNAAWSVNPYAIKDEADEIDSLF